MKHGILTLIIFAVIFAFITPAYAAVYSDGDNGLSIDIEYGDGVYYYTPEKNNLFNDLTQKINSDGRDVRFFVTKYNPDNSQPYALLITAEPLNLTNTDDINLLDITAFPHADKDAVISEVLSEYTADFNFTDPVDSALGGVSAILIKGVNKEDPEDNLDIYINSNGSSYIITQAQYFTSTDTSQINSLINSVQYSEDLIASANESNTVSEETAPTPAPTVIAEITTITDDGEQMLSNNGDTQSSPGGIGGFFAGICNSIKNAYQNDPFFIWYIIGAAVILAIIIILTITARKRRAKDRGFESQFDVEEDLTVLEEISITPHSKDEETKKSEPRLLMTEFENDERSAPRKIVHMMDDTVFYNAHCADGAKNSEDLKNRIDEQIEIEEEEEENDMSNVADFEKDISKYTQQPGSDVNDISKNTVNAADAEDLAEEIERTRVAGKTRSDTPSWKTQGTRMSRHKKKK